MEKLSPNDRETVQSWIEFVRNKEWQHAYHPHLKSVCNRLAEKPKCKVFGVDVFNYYHAYCRPCAVHIYSETKQDDKHSFHIRHVNSRRHQTLIRNYPKSREIFHESAMHVDCLVCKCPVIKEVMVKRLPLSEKIRNHSLSSSHLDKAYMWNNQDMCLLFSIAQSIPFKIAVQNKYCNLCFTAVGNKVEHIEAYSHLMTLMKYLNKFCNGLNFEQLHNEASLVDLMIQKLKVMHDEVADGRVNPCLLASGEIDVFEDESLETSSAIFDDDGYLDDDSDYHSCETAAFNTGGNVKFGNLPFKYQLENVIGFLSNLRNEREDLKKLPDMQEDWRNSATDCGLSIDSRGSTNERRGWRSEMALVDTIVNLTPGGCYIPDLEAHSVDETVNKMSSRHDAEGRGLGIDDDTKNESCSAKSKEESLNAATKCQNVPTMNSDGFSTSGSRDTSAIVCESATNDIPRDPSISSIGNAEYTYVHNKGQNACYNSELRDQPPNEMKYNAPMLHGQPMVPSGMYYAQSSGEPYREDPRILPMYLANINGHIVYYTPAADYPAANVQSGVMYYSGLEHPTGGPSQMASTEMYHPIRPSGEMCQSIQPSEEQIKAQMVNSAVLPLTGPNGSTGDSQFVNRTLVNHSEPPGPCNPGASLHSATGSDVVPYSIPSGPVRPARVSGTLENSSEPGHHVPSVKSAAKPSIEPVLSKGSSSKLAKACLTPDSKPGPSSVSDVPENSSGSQCIQAKNWLISYVGFGLGGGCIPLPHPQLMKRERKGLSKVFVIEHFVEFFDVVSRDHVYCIACGVHLYDHTSTKLEAKYSLHFNSKNHLLKEYKWDSNSEIYEMTKEGLRCFACDMYPVKDPDHQKMLISKMTITHKAHQKHLNNVMSLANYLKEWILLNRPYYIELNPSFEAKTQESIDVAISRLDTFLAMQNLTK